MSLACWLTQNVECPRSATEFGLGLWVKKGQVVLSREIPDDDNILKAFIWLIWAEWSPVRTELGATSIIKV